jgi:hypothetical protein
MAWVKNTDEWIANLKVGDSVYTIERCKSYPDGVWKWESKVTGISESSCIETVFERDYKLQWLLELTKDLAPNHRTYAKTWTKNYFAPDGTINIEQIK